MSIDKRDFSKIVALVNQSISVVLSTYYIQQKKNIEIIPTETDGWEVNLKYIPSLKCHLEIWLDRWSGHVNRKLWYGFFSTKKQNIINLSKKYSDSNSNPLIITEKEVDENTSQYKSKLKNKLARKDFEVPVLELYSNFNYYFYGIYEYTPLPKSKTEQNKLVERIASFYDSILKSSGIGKKDFDSNDYPRTENRKKVVSHILRERNPFLSTLRKQKDNYKCSICGFKYEDKYNEFGKGFAEAHHIIPLSKLKSQTKTNLDDLITVCASCHRMLHRMDGNASDINRLKKIIKKR